MKSYMKKANKNEVKIDESAKAGCAKQQDPRLSQATGQINGAIQNLVIQALTNDLANARVQIDDLQNELKSLRSDGAVPDEAVG